MLGLLSNRVNAAMLHNKPPGPEGSAAKLVATDLARCAASLAVQIAGPSAQAWSVDDPAGDHWDAVLLMTPGLSIAGGTDEIVRNIIGERVLGLSKEPCLDTGPINRS